jgi:TPR repeat protein
MEEKIRELVRSDSREYIRVSTFAHGLDFLRKVAEARLEIWEWSARIGIPEGEWLIASCYLHQILNSRGTTPTPRELLTRASEREFAPAQCDLSHYVRFGKFGAPPDPERALALLDRAAAKGYLRAEHEIAGCYHHGWGVEKNLQNELRLLFDLAKRGYAPAQEEIGTRYRLGQDGLPKDSVKALEWYLKAAEQGHAEAQFGVGCLFYNGEGIAKDKQRSKAWFEKASAQEHGPAFQVIETERKKFFPWW